MRRLRPPLLLVFALLACEDEDRPRGDIDVAPRYLATGVVRVENTQSVGASLRPFRFALADLALEAGEVTGRAEAPAGGPPWLLTGRYDLEADQYRFDGATTAVLTASTAEQVVSFAFRAEDGRPEDMVASELVGSVSTATPGSTANGRWLGVEDVPDQVPPPDPALISITPSPTRVGEFVVEGAPGASVGGAGIQVFRFTPARETPDVFTFPVEFSGEFAFPLVANPGDIVLFRAQVARRNGDAAIVTVPR